MKRRFRGLLMWALLWLTLTLTIVLVEYAGSVLSLYLLAVAIGVIGAGCAACRLLPPVESAARKAAREAVKNSGIHPAGRGRVIDPADAAPVVDPSVAAAAEALEVEPTDLRMGLRFDEPDILNLMGAVKAEQWQAWSDNATALSKKLAAQIYRKHQRSVKRGRR